MITNDPHFTTSAKIYGIAKLLWDFEGDRTTSDSGGRGEWEYTDYAEGHFILPIADISAELKKKITISVEIKLDWYPSIWKYQYADGTSRYRTDSDN